MKSAVVVIDVQSILFDPEPQPFEAKQVLNRINHITQSARAKSVPVIFVQHEQADSAIEYGSEGWALQSSLVTENGDHFIRKSSPDSFLNTELQSLLTELDVERLIVCGYATEFCVDSTVRRAAGLGYPVTLVADAHTTHDKPHASGELIRAHHNFALSSISSFPGKTTAVKTTDLWQ